MAWDDRPVDFVPLVAVAGIIDKTPPPPRPPEPSPSEEDRIVGRMDSSRRVRRLMTHSDVLDDFIRENGGSRSDAARYLFGD